MYSSALTDPVLLSISNPTPSNSPDPSSSPPALPVALANASNAVTHEDFRRLVRVATDNDASAKPQYDRKDNIWSDMSTACLLEEFQEKWIALRRGNLRSSNWEEVASKVNLRCGVSRTGEQCRHKMEKLRRKYREEKALRDRLCFRPSKWMWYDRFEAMLGDGKAKESGISACNEVARNNAVGDALDRTTSSNRMEGVPLGMRPQYNMDAEFRMNPTDLMPAEKNEKDAASFTSTSQRASDAVGVEDCGAEPNKGKLAVKGNERRRKGNSLLPALKSFMDGMLRIEQHKIELQKDNERLRCEMELKRTELLVGLELKRTQMQLEMVKAVTRTKVKKAKTGKKAGSTTRSD